MMWTEKFGGKIDVGFDRVKNDEWGNIQGPQDPSGKTEFIDSKPFETHYFRVDLQAVVNFGKMLEMYKIHKNLGLLAHFGFGFASLKNQKHSVWFQDWKSQGSDEMMNLMLGLTPQFRVGDHWEIHLDFSVVANAWQSKTWDFTENNFEKGLHGRIWNFSAGTSWYFGRHGKDRIHMDWTPPSKPGSSDVVNNTSTLVPKSDTIRTVETIHTIETIRVNGQNVDQANQNGSNGPDADGDGVTDDRDACPAVFGRAANGCPNFDTDSDGVPDTKDRCPEIAGVVENDGCPQLDAKIKELIDQARQDIEFVNNSDEFLESSLPLLDKLVKMMKDNPEITLLQMHVHADGSGPAEPARRLSSARGEKLIQYLIDKGVNSERLEAKGHGGTRPIADSNTPEGRAENERVEIKVIN
jgi:outer membrane protein OmpA-like peptidoglycan-associated protein